MLPESLQSFEPAAALDAALPDAMAGGNSDHGEFTLQIEPARLLEVLRHLKQQGFERLSGITAVDYYPVEPRFQVVYLMQSVARNLGLRLKCQLSGDAPEIESATAVYGSANWYERETFDLFGIAFRGHPNLTRIMMPANWVGHPLRRDYPVHGYKYSYGND